MVRIPVNVEQRYLYKAKISDERSAHVDARLTATTTENLPAIMEKGEKVKVSGHDAVYEEDTTSWKYTVDMGHLCGWSGNVYESQILYRR